ncbi:AP-1 complex subunit sigma-3, partial [Lamprotornis superbus]
LLQNPMLYKRSHGPPEATSYLQEPQKDNVMKVLRKLIHFILLFSRQGKLRLQKWYTTLPDKEKKKIIREIVQIILSRNQKTSSFVDWKDLKLVYKRYASLYFCCAIEDQDNELLTLEVVHRYVCELDIIFNFEKAYFILDEFIIGGEVQETSKKTAVKAMEESDMLQESANKTAPTAPRMHSMPPFNLEDCLETQLIYLDLLESRVNEDIQARYGLNFKCYNAIYSAGDVMSVMN